MPAKAIEDVRLLLAIKVPVSEEVPVSSKDIDQVFQGVAKGSSTEANLSSLNLGVVVVRLPTYLGTAVPLSSTFQTETPSVW